MAVCTFTEGMKSGSKFIFRPGCKSENIGVFSDVRVDRTTLPEGWNAYDIRDGENGFCTIEKNYVLVNHGGTFLTQKPIRFPKEKDGTERDWMHLCGRGGYTFA